MIGGAQERLTSHSAESGTENLSNPFPKLPLHKSVTISVRPQKRVTEDLSSSKSSSCQEIRRNKELAFEPIGDIG
jgi:hypothetical protein